MRLVRLGSLLAVLSVVCILPLAGCGNPSPATLTDRAQAWIRQTPFEVQQGTEVWTYGTGGTPAKWDSTVALREPLRTTLPYGNESVTYTWKSAAVGPSIPSGARDLNVLLPSTTTSSGVSTTTSQLSQTLPGWPAQGLSAQEVLAALQSQLSASKVTLYLLVALPRGYYAAAHWQSGRGPRGCEVAADRGEAA